MSSVLFLALAEAAAVTTSCSRRAITSTRIGAAVAASAKLTHYPQMTRTDADQVRVDPWHLRHPRFAPSDAPAGARTCYGLAAVSSLAMNSS